MQQSEINVSDFKKDMIGVLSSLDDDSVDGYKTNVKNVITKNV